MGWERARTTTNTAPEAPVITLPPIQAAATPADDTGAGALGATTGRGTSGLLSAGANESARLPTSAAPSM